ncbi:MAG: CDP-alcohol phosphatidyltransferase family protein [Desulfobacteraceae bacterium]|nr:CDP-alcohol phosphatidyltransferase family protein [Desulfobacteraceae bacterium]
MANLITLGRFILLIVLIVLAYAQNPKLQLVNCPLLVIIFVLDGVDGYVARKRNEASLFGAIFDIAIDRVVENVLWVVLVDLRIIPVWIAVVFLIRGFVVDSIRSQGASEGQTPFGMIRSPIGKFIVASSFMRLFYGTLKAVTFGFIFLIQPWPALFPSFYTEFQTMLTAVKWILVYATVTVCMIRGLPVIFEFTTRENGLFSAFRK